MSIATRLTFWSACTCQASSRRRAAIASAVVGVTAVTSLAAGASSNLPLYYGPGSPPTSSTGYRSATITYAGRTVSNAGVGIGNANAFSGGIDTGKRGLTYSRGSITQLGTLSGANPPTGVNAINANGVAAGTITRTQTSTVSLRPVRWAAGSTTPVELALPANAFASNGYVNATVLSVADDGGVGGSVTLYNGATVLGFRGAVWAAGGTAISLRQPATLASSGVGQSAVIDLNAAGVAVGYADRYVSDVNLGSRPVRWAPGSTIGGELEVPFASPTGFKYGSAQYVNAGGMAAGVIRSYSGSTNTGDRGARWAAGGVSAEVLYGLGTDLMGSVETFSVTGLNDGGTAIGAVTAYSNSFDNRGFQAVRWAPGSGAAIPLGGIGVDVNGAGQSVPYAINNLGVIVGASTTAASSEDFSAALWLPGASKAVDLNTLIAPDANYRMIVARDVSETGWVVGSGVYDPDGAGQAVAYNRLFTLLVPEAGTYGKGDANFDTQINFADLLILAQKYGLPNANKAPNVADFDLNGATDFGDLLKLAQNYGTPASFAADWAVAQSLVPEPSLLLALAFFPRRRRL